MHLLASNMFLFEAFFHRAAALFTGAGFEREMKCLRTEREFM